MYKTYANVEEYYQELLAQAKVATAEARANDPQSTINFEDYLDAKDILYDYNKFYLQDKIDAELEDLDIPDNIYDLKESWT